MLLEAAVGVTVFSEADAVVGESLVPVIEVEHGVTGALVDAGSEVLVAGGAAVFENEVVATERNETGPDVGHVYIVADMSMWGMKRSEFLAGRVVVFLATVFDAGSDLLRKVCWHEGVA